MTAKTLPGFDFRSMCLAGVRAAEAAHEVGCAVARCPRTGAQLQCGEFGIWYVAVSAPRGMIMPPVEGTDVWYHAGAALLDEGGCVTTMLDLSGRGGPPCPSAD